MIACPKDNLLYKKPELAPLHRKRENSASPKLELNFKMPSNLPVLLKLGHLKAKTLQAKSASKSDGLPWELSLAWQPSM